MGGNVVPEGGSIPDDSSLRGCLSHTAKKHFAVYFLLFGFCSCDFCHHPMNEYLFIHLFIFSL